MKISIDDAKNVLRTNLLQMKFSGTSEYDFLCSVFETILEHIDRLEKGQYAELLEKYKK